MSTEFTLPLPTTHPLDPKRPRFGPPGTRATLRVRWARLKRRIGGSAPDESLGEPTTAEASDNGSVRRKTTKDGSKEGGSAEEDLETGVVDEVVVDNSAEFADWGLKVPQISGGGGSGSGGGGTRNSPGTGLPHQSEASSYRGTAHESTRLFGGFTNFCRWRVYPVLL